MARPKGSTNKKSTDTPAKVEEVKVAPVLDDGIPENKKRHLK